MTDTNTEAQPVTKVEVEFFQRMERKYNAKLAEYMAEKNWLQVEALTLWYGMFLAEFGGETLREVVERPHYVISPDGVTRIPGYYMSLV